MVTGRKLSLKLLLSFSKEYNLINVDTYHPGMINVGDLTPMEWLQLIKNCDCVVTTFFHGSCFSLINNTPFVTFGSYRSSKIEGLFSDMTEEIQQHYIQNTDTFLESDYFAHNLMKRLVRINDIDNYLVQQRKSFTISLNQLNTIETEELK